VYPTAADVTRRTVAMSDADDILASHVPDSTGLCVGCASSDCELGEDARTTIETFGVTAADWSYPRVLQPVS
jgi:hypothetical protein